MDNYELHHRWRDAIIGELREMLRAMSDDEFIAHASFAIGRIGSDSVRESMMNAMMTALDSHQRTRVSGCGVRDVGAVMKMMRDEYGFVIRR